MHRSPISLTGPLLAVLAVFCACSIDVSKLRAPGYRDAGVASERGIQPGDTAPAGVDSGRRDTGADPDTRSGGEPDSGVTPDMNGDRFGAGSGGTGGFGGNAGSGGDPNPDLVDGGAPVDAALGEDGASEDGTSEDGTSEDGASDDGAAGQPTADSPDVADDSEPTQDWGAVDGAPVLDAPAPAGDAQNDAQDDVFVVDARGKKTCPTTISLDRTDSTQVGRLSRMDSASVCGKAKDFPGNGADKTNSHLYDVYHFINATGEPACIAFTLTYSAHQELYAAAYSAFDPSDISRSYLGDTGDTLASPQTVGLTVDAGGTFDITVAAVALGTDPAGSYTLSCSVQ